MAGQENLARLRVPSWQHEKEIVPRGVSVASPKRNSTNN